MIKYDIKNNYYGSIFLLIIAALFAIFRNPNIFFFANVVILIVTLLKCKFSFFSLKTIIIFYTLLPFFFKYNFNYVYGIFESTNLLYYLLINIILFLYLFFWLFIYFNTNILHFEKEKYIKKINIKKSYAIFFSAMAIVVTLIRFPSLPFLKEYDRFVSLLPGNGWNHVVMILLAFSIPKLKESNFIKFAFLFVIVWFFGHYERVDCLGIICLLTIIFLSNVKLNFKKIFITIITFIFLFFLLNVIESARMGNSINLSNIFTKVLVQSTASDVGYTLDRAIDYTKKNDLLYGKTYLKYATEVVPMIEYKDSSINILNQEYYTVGGEFILNEPYMNFGILGVIIFSIIEFLLLYLLLKQKSMYSVFALYTLVFSVFRIVWYGISYVETALIWYIPLILLFIKILNKIKMKRGKVFGKG